MEGDSYLNHFHANKSRFTQRNSTAISTVSFRHLKTQTYNLFYTLTQFCKGFSLSMTAWQRRYRCNKIFVLILFDNHPKKLFVNHYSQYSLVQNPRQIISANEHIRSWLQGRSGGGKRDLW